MTAIPTLQSLVELEPIRGEKRFFSTGVRIDPNWILCAAHSVDGANQVSVRPWNQGQRSSILVEETRIFIHDRYYEDQSFHDLALIFCPDLNQACLSQLDQNPTIHAPTDIIGAFRLGLSKKDHSIQLSETPVEWIDCQITYDPIAKQNFEKSKLDMVLYRNRETQAGHSGGPVFIIKNGIPTLIAIHCGTKGGPSGDQFGYGAAIFSHREWIQKHLLTERFQRPITNPLRDQGLGA